MLAALAQDPSGFAGFEAIKIAGELGVFVVLVYQFLKIYRDQVTSHREAMERVHKSYSAQITQLHESHQAEVRRLIEAFRETTHHLTQKMDERPPR